ncbi:Phosphoribosylcarboxyaminoimidazole (NCAIR) mutase PurE [Methanonatronarchaeum thermophilum]|uniref:N5-carboxyaminoimidazole ribonucleotide mutase n=1 Tax=Methanonatronarchaeum thermophilum TaxID=1927129 RepID=A0A1Y3GEK5_9EURY|nr:5-(carboxyamino)imidazole ribonucleotide mutase [Methanonatronarchaeum thermophilum]OUJ18733.1 Phosphoribosylcarboxyaminoimidazole (NCAIR) mutase PurE [Methanonatronarchaeum thermophilum]
MVEIAIIMGSESDMPVAEKAFDILDQKEIEYEVEVISAHRNPEKLEKYIKQSDAKVYIAIAGLAAALPGVIASHTDKPVIGVPVNAKLDGLDALLSIVQMPKGVPVACVGIDRADNAAILAQQILKT